MAVTLNPQQQAVVDNRGGELLVAAAAGSGKTFVLVERLLSRVLGEEKADILDFVVITYTNEAAKELKHRIGQEFQQRLQVELSVEGSGDLELLKHLHRQIRLLPRARISTIHSFCTSLLRDQGHIIQLNPNFRVCSAGEASILQNMMVEKTIDHWYAEQEEDSPFYQMVDTLAYGNLDARLPHIVLDIYGKIQSHENPEAWVANLREEWNQVAGSDLSELNWGKLLLGKYQQDLALAIQDTQNLQDFCDFQGGDFCTRFQAMVQLSKEQKKLIKDGGNLDTNFLSLLKTLAVTVEDTLGGKRSWDAVLEEASSLKMANVKKVKETDFDEKAVEKAELFRGNIKKRLKSFDHHSSQEELQQILPLKEHTLVLMDLVLDFSRRFQEEKKKRHWLDYGDLEHATVELLHTEEGPSDYALRVARGIKEMMVDEYQDTNRVQNAIFNALSQEGKRLFLVGDMKQAIYRFRLADPSIFSEKQERFHKVFAPDGSQIPAQEGEPRLLKLDKNFRSRQEVLSSCNDFFADVMSKDFGEVDYLQEGMLQLGGSFPELSPSPYEAEFYLLDMEPYETRRKETEEGEKVEKALGEARFVAQKIKSMVEEGVLISEKDGVTLRPARYSDFMILVRGKKSAVPLYGTAMAEQNIPIDLSYGEDILDTVEVSIAMGLLQIIDNPLQDVPLLSVLQSPLFGFTPDELAVLKRGRGGRFFEILSRAKEPGDFEQMGAELSSQWKETWHSVQRKRELFLDFLKKARQAAGEKTPSHLLWDVYLQCNVLSLFGAMERGEERQENLRSFHQMIGGLDCGGSLSLALKQVEQLKKLGEIPTAPKTLREGEAVVLHSIHKSKGLEKPVVFVAGLSKEINVRDLQEQVLFHQHYGMGLKQYDSQQNELNSTLPYEAIRLTLLEETYSEELRILYVAMTRAREKLILLYSSNNLKKSLDKQLKVGTKPVNPRVLMEQKSMGDIFLAYFLTRPEGEPLQAWSESQYALTEQGTDFQPSTESHWHCETVDYDSIHQNLALLQEEAQAIPETEPHLLAQCQEFFPLHYAHEADTHTFSKITATQTKGRKILLEELGESGQMQGLRSQEDFAEPWELGDLDEKLEETLSLEEKLEKKKAYFQPRVPSFAQKAGKLTPAERGTALHSFMEFLELSPSLDCSLDSLERRKQQLLAEGKLSERQAEAISLKGVEGFLQSRWGQEACASSHCAQEFKFSLLVEGTLLGEESSAELLLQGVVDCWYRNERGEIVLVDFKSDRVNPQDLELKALEHGNQMKVYGLALSRILTKEGEAPPKIGEKVLWFTEINQGVLVP